MIQRDRLMRPRRHRRIAKYGFFGPVNVENGFIVATHLITGVLIHAGAGDARLGQQIPVGRAAKLASGQFIGHAKLHGVAL